MIAVVLALVLAWNGSVSGVSAKTVENSYEYGATAGEVTEETGNLVDGYTEKSEASVNESAGKTEEEKTEEPAQKPTDEPNNTEQETQKDITASEEEQIPAEQKPEENEKVSMEEISAEEGNRDFGGKYRSTRGREWAKGYRHSCRGNGNTGSRHGSQWKLYLWRKSARFAGT